MRRFRSVALLLLGTACASGGGTSAPAGPAPAPAPGAGPMVTPTPTRDAIRYPRTGAGISRYAFARRDSVVATMPSGETQQLVFGRTAYLTVTWIAADSGTRITATVDSLVPDSALNMASLAMLDSARGARWTGLRTRSGRLVNLTGGITSLTSDQIRDQLQLLFPLLPDSGVRPGGRWTDSLQVPGRVGAFEANEAVTVLSEAASIAPGLPLPIQVLRQRTASGTGSQFGQELTVAGTGVDSLTYELSPEGRVLRAEGMRHTSVVVTLPAIGQTVPADETSVLRMTLLR